MTSKRRPLFALFACMVLVTAWGGWSVLASAQGPGSHPLPPSPTSLGAARLHEPTEPADPSKEPSEAEGGAPAEINWSDFGAKTPPFLALTVNFGILMAGYYLFGKKPIAAALQNRRDTIARDIEEAQKMRREAEARAKTYQAKLDRLEEELASARSALVQAGEAERERIVTDAEAKAVRLRKDAEFLVEQELKQIRVDLQRETVETAIAAAEELLRKRITQADQERLAEDYLADLATKGRPVAGGAP